MLAMVARGDSGSQEGFSILQLDLNNPKNTFIHVRFFVDNNSGIISYPIANTDINTATIIV